MLARSIVCVTGSAALARDLCIQIDTGTNAGSLLVLKKVKVRPRSLAPVQGYFARYSAATSSFASFTPLYGQSITNAIGIAAFGITFQAANVAPGGSGNSPSAPQWISMRCFPGTNTTIDLLDSCAPFINSVADSAHVVPCTPEAAIP